MTMIEGGVLLVDLTRFNICRHRLVPQIDSDQADISAIAKRSSGTWGSLENCPQVRLRVLTLPGHDRHSEMAMRNTRRALIGLSTHCHPLHRCQAHQVSVHGLSKNAGQVQAISGSCRPASPEPAILPARSKEEAANPAPIAKFDLPLPNPLGGRQVIQRNASEREREQNKRRPSVAF